MKAKFTYTRSPTPLAQYLQWRVGFTATMCGHLIFVHGGNIFMGAEQRSDAVLDMVTLNWKPLPMYLPRSFHAACLVDDKIFVIGGESTGREDLTAMIDLVDGNIERCDGWSHTRNMPMACHRHVAEFFEKRREIVVFGGRNGYAITFLDQLFSLNVDSMKWRKMRSKGQFPGPQSSHTSCRRNDVMFVLCNHGSPNIVDLFLFDYSQTIPVWTVLNKYGNPPIGIYGNSMNLIGSKIIVYGGYRQQAVVNHLSIYDLKDMSWTSGCYSSSRQYGTGLPHTVDVDGIVPPRVGRHHGEFTKGKLRFIGGGNIDFLRFVDLDLDFTN